VITVADAKRVLKAQDRAERVEVAARGALPPTITLFESRFEEAAIELESFDLVLTDPPYGVSGTDIRRPYGQGTALIRDFGAWDRGEMPIADWASSQRRATRE
jgi:hypothetical protein